MDTMDSSAWNQRYADSELVWSAAPNIWVEHLTQDLPPGKALDVAAGEGRSALWLAARGWHVTAVGFSAVALQRAASLAIQRLGDDAETAVRSLTDAQGQPAEALDALVLAQRAVG